VRCEVMSMMPVLLLELATPQLPVPSRVAYRQEIATEGGRKAMRDCTIAISGAQWRVTEMDPESGVTKDTLWDGEVLSQRHENGMWLIAPRQLLRQTFGARVRIAAFRYYELQGYACPATVDTIDTGLRLHWEESSWLERENDETFVVRRAREPGRTTLWFVDKEFRLARFEAWSGGRLFTRGGCKYSGTLRDGYLQRIEAMHRTAPPMELTQSITIAVASIELEESDSWWTQPARKPGETVMDGRFLDVDRTSAFLQYTHSASPAAVVRAYGEQEPARRSVATWWVVFALVGGAIVRALMNAALRRIVGGMGLICVVACGAVAQEAPPSVAEIVAATSAWREGLKNAACECWVTQKGRPAMRMLVAWREGQAVSVDWAHGNSDSECERDYLRSRTVLTPGEYYVDWVIQRAYEVSALPASQVPERFRMQMVFSALGWWPAVATSQKPMVFECALDYLPEVTSGAFVFDRREDIEGRRALFLFSKRQRMWLDERPPFAVLRREWLDAEGAIIRRLAIKWESGDGGVLPVSVTMDMDPTGGSPEGVRFLNAEVKNWRLEAPDRCFERVPRPGLLAMRREQTEWKQEVRGGLEILEEVARVMSPARSMERAWGMLVLATSCSLVLGVVASKRAGAIWKPAPRTDSV
jgi:hypothetical protein